MCSMLGMFAFSAGRGGACFKLPDNIYQGTRKGLQENTCLVLFIFLCNIKTKYLL